jgi:hypothetical protein
MRFSYVLITSACLMNKIMSFLSINKNFPFKKMEYKIAWMHAQMKCATHACQHMILRYPGLIFCHNWP